ncbi:hypothetical protein BjapCC829_10845 [Bradyrhizobium barranii]|uniref:Uncharacterized protein n=1 Tax=Bradyrhizobium barranii TaxID=2992140 RepID=A0ABY3QSG2_9BRAD|nr:hypothetical protein [Bradyrhizobium japonicum]UFW88960.1 hypothetical protein BjapCC829_10845 [Bradyrhizobium japonicum]
MAASFILKAPTSAYGPSRTSGDVRFHAAVEGIADIKRRQAIAWLKHHGVLRGGFLGQ